ncbi:hypothetical protein ZYGR_0AD06200 [Zygosaccharomyces rouxii]|uniref:ZYRO0G20350p n=2 Tax=Zygosaccharomyces rouxii TaxID=4956 RepID=C5E1E5_ZYGRC|nr:uncharacterized protein ZYRO0G20350g [Zygosaccharomyces rouxii]KAH9202920.1 hypothetical protein LQ764DRAFT_72607 [Zygosaccharomyces rouxii]GAV51437.1 hypothetical protein ZYGR_0AD06200 [Zygosaccharomyces rouxii]CAR29929.1 ZYRO0G20350p [Zygosaccharomyces rouxii]
MLIQLGLNRSSLFLRPSVVSRSTTLTRQLAKRYQSTVKTSFDEELQILRAQRKNRPISPHLTIYQPQMTWYLSSLHRVSGVMLGAAFYCLTIAFGVSTLFGLGLNTENLTTWYKEKVPTWFDWTAKGGVAYLFAFHISNGVRHLVWDLGKQVTNPGVIRTGWAVLAFTAVAGTTFLFK